MKTITNCNTKHQVRLQTQRLWNDKGDKLNRTRQHLQLKLKPFYIHDVLVSCFHQLDTNLDILGNKESQLRNCLHQIDL